jgi:hypothetical protein
VTAPRPKGEEYGHGTIQCAVYRAGPAQDCMSLPCFRRFLSRSKPSRCQTRHALEMTREMTLVGKPDCARHFRQRPLA